MNPTQTQSLGSTSPAALGSVDAGDEWDDAFQQEDVDFKCAETELEMSRLFDAKPLTYQSASSALKAELKDRVMAGEPHRNPTEFLRFIVKHTNPSKVLFSWKNLLAAIADCARQLSLSPLVNVVLSQNCVHCARAVDQTLRLAFSHKAGAGAQMDLLQVNQRKMGEFYEICGMDRLQNFSSKPNDRSQYLEQLQGIVRPGQLACISVPVTAALGAFGHAMNIVNMGPAEQGGQDRVFVLCGQSGKVFDLLKDTDVADFLARHTCSDPDNDGNVFFTPPQAMDSGAADAAAAVSPSEQGPPLGTALA